MPYGGVFFSDDSKDRLDRRKIILVEGVDDAHLIDRILIDLGCNPKDIGVVYTLGDGEFIKNVKELIKSSHYVRGEIRNLTIIRDSDDNPVARQNDMGASFQTIGLPAPLHNDFMDIDDGRSLGYFSIPSIDEHGAIEDLVLSSVSETALYGDCRQLLDSRVGELAADLRYMKRLLQIYLAVSPTRKRGGGAAFKEGVVFDPLSPVFADLRDFVARLAAL